MLAASFLGGAKERLLPAFVPFRYFIAAAGFHVLAWFVLVLGANDLPGFTGGPGLVLASLHLLTLGVLVMTAMGASFQLLPIATRQPLSRKWPANISFWLFMPGTAILTWGMVEASSLALYAGGAAVCGGLLVYTVLTADNLRKAGSAMPIVSAHGWGALVSLILFAALGLGLIFDFDTGYLANRVSVTATHMVLGVFGFMSLLAFGFSQILIPMFVLSRALPARLGWLELALALLSVTMATAGAILQNNTVMVVAVIAGVGACAAYLLLMRSAFQTSMRKRLGLSFVVIKLSWIMLVFALLTGLAVMLGLPVPNGLTLFGFLLLAGWLLTFVTGILQRIMPFLASMHVVDKRGRSPLLSELTAERPLMVHAICHFLALVTCSTGIVLDAPMIIRIGAVFGLLGAVAFVVFAGFVVGKLKLR